MKNMRHQGFTLIELVVVIVILGILAATAIPKFVSIQVEAADASAKGTAAALSSGTAINYAKFLASGGGGTAVVAATLCSTLPTNFLSGGVMPDASLTIVTPGAAMVGCGASGNIDSTCMVKHANGTAGGFAVKALCTG